MQCPFCGFADARMKVHRHLLEAHLDRVATEYDETSGKMKYVIPCPVCGLRYQHAVKPRYRDPRFLEEYKAEIGLVAFDQLLYHLEERHPVEAGLPDRPQRDAETGLPDPSSAASPDQSST